MTTIKVIKLAYFFSINIPFLNLLNKFFNSIQYRNIYIYKLLHYTLENIGRLNYGNQYGVL